MRAGHAYPGISRHCCGKGCSSRFNRGRRVHISGGLPHTLPGRVDACFLITMNIEFRYPGSPVCQDRSYPLISWQ